MIKKDIDIKTALIDFISKLPPGKEILRLYSLKREYCNSQIFKECRDTLLNQIVFGKNFCVCDEIAQIYITIKPRKQKFVILLQNDCKIYIPFLASREEIHYKVIEAFKLSFKKVVHR